MTQSPKEYAFELVEKYCNNIEDRTQTFLLSTFSAKQCVLIAINEIIKSRPSLPITDGACLIEDIELSTIYYQEVLKEIELIN